MTSASHDEGPRRMLFASLVFFVVTHVVALGTMALVLGPGMDPGASSVDARMAWIAAHASTWRLGWLPWQLSAVSDLGVCVALIAWARGTARAAAIVAIVLDGIAAIPEQWAELRLVTSFVDASRADADAWRASWSLYAAITGVWANGVYTAMTACWLFVARRTLGRGVMPLAIELAMLLLFTIAGVLTYAATRSATDAETAIWFARSTVCNGLAFPALVLWTSLLAWRVRVA